MEEKNLIKYKWDTGVYDLKRMVRLVLNNKISEKQFFNITRYNFKSVKEKQSLN